MFIQNESCSGQRTSKAVIREENYILRQSIRIIF